ncbi:MAG: metalloregulator ArsR/SmtB family transcription factor [Candidatus Bathyarchaeia archaeon]
MRVSIATKRLERLVASGICPAEDTPKYAMQLKELTEKTVDERTAERESELFKALADPTRGKILALLGVRKMCVCEIMVALDLTQPTASHHLGILERVGLIKDERVGKWIFYSIANPELTKLIQKIKSLIVT